MRFRIFFPAPAQPENRLAMRPSALRAHANVSLTRLDGNAIGAGLILHGDDTIPARGWGRGRRARMYGRAPSAPFFAGDFHLCHAPAPRLYGARLVIAKIDR